MADARIEPVTTDTDFFDRLRRGLRVQVSVIIALMFKTFRSKSTVNRLGMLFPFVQPIQRVIMYTLMWVIMGRTEIAGVSIFLVIGAAMIPHAMVRHALNAIPDAMMQNRSLYAYQQVKPFDSLLARYILDITMLCIANVVMLLGMWWFGGLVPLYPYPLAALGLLGLTLVMGFGLSLLVGVYSCLSPTVDSLARLATRPLMLTSAIFYTANQLPPAIRYLISWSPFAQISELMRYYMLGMTPFPEADVTYVVLCTSLFLGWGFLAYYVNRIKILAAI